MPKIAIYDVVVIGSGAAGSSAVEAAHAQGASVCLIESDRLGGECPNDACVPSKALLKSAGVYRALQQARNFGIQTGTVSFEFSQMMNYRRVAVETITGGGSFGDRYVAQYREMGVTVKKGRAQFIDKDLLEVDGEPLRGRAFVIATGTVDFIPPIPGLDRVKFTRAKETLTYSRQPKSMAIIGGGPVGCEIATFYATLGTRVVLLQSASQVLHREDPEISQYAREALEELKVEVVTGANVFEIVNGGSGVYGVHVEVAGNRKMHAVDQLVLAAGNRANTQQLGLSEVGVKMDERGFILTNKEQRTSATQVYAAGDVDGGLQFTHTAHHEGYVAGHNAAISAKKKRTTRLKTDESVVPRVTFLSPEVASVGMTAPDAKKTYKRLLVGRANMRTLGRSVTDHAASGFLKIIADAKTHKILGAHMIGPRAGEVIHELALAIHVGATVEKVASLIHAYPTFSEAIPLALASLTVE